MRQFSWRMDPEEFVRELTRWAARARRSAAGTAGGRRHVREVVRRRRGWYRRLTGLASFPSMPMSYGMEEAWRSARPEDLRIVIPMEPSTSSLNQGDWPQALSRRKRMRRLMHEATPRDGSISLVTARSGRRRLPSIARSVGGPRVELRGLYLDALGVAIMPALSEEQVEAFENAGALVIFNEEVGVDDPAGEPSSKGTPTASHLASIGIAAAREAGLTGKGVLIGVLDTGIDAKHPEFAGKSVQFMAFKPNGERRTVGPKDFGNHGTHVAALCAGRNVGVAPGADLAVAAVLTERNAKGGMSGYTSQILAGMNWLAGSGQLPRPVDLLNASLGSQNSGANYHLTVSTHRLAGVTLVAAIGNSGRLGIGHLGAPGMLDCAIGVGAVDDRGMVADFSDWGDCFSTPVPSTESKPDIMAPGVAVESAVPGGSYARMDGTSMACPLVTGAAALLIERDEDLRDDPDALTAAVFALAVPLPSQPKGYDPRRGGRGRLSLASLAK